ncbi:Peptidase family M23 [Tessaracoccus bendigoensis DSM 12906]|uniref:Peptidase family M23 n=1 Tax=Tessaracoccus bendigoensis DSM 12906 TaxID=1123357 RepID=A0A1M6ER21_9ACTN|nr:M23 family metallopeptidase [Tessaracoccus bendigoensis]SHI87941.1 Peptidase family M23 [Tessaracoccus bendigoensis DSM 12906]
MRKTLLAVFVALLIGAANVAAAPTARAAELPDFPMALPIGWGLTVQGGGTHTFSTGVRSSVDLGASGGVSVAVVAAADGVVKQVQANCQVVITHSGGWETKYYHLKSITSLSVGQKISAGTKLGMTAMPGSETCGRGNFRHLHFTLLRNGVEKPIDGLSLGGYTIHSTGGSYCGYWTRDSDGAIVADARRSCYAVPKVSNTLIHPSDLARTDAASRGEARPTVASTDTIDAAKLYTTPGQHSVGGRAWKTACEPYSQTTRCRTEIWATVAVLQGGSYVRKEGWAFNNLTYLDSKRELWKNNPLGNAPSGKSKEWVASDGRSWRTECDTALTGKGACRSYARTTVVSAVARSGGGYNFSSKTAWTFNSIVRFSN